MDTTTEAPQTPKAKRLHSLGLARSHGNTAVGWTHLMDALEPITEEEQPAHYEATRPNPQPEEKFDGDQRGERGEY